MSNKYEDLIKNARINADCGEHMSPAEVTTLLNVVETTFAALAAENAGLKSKGRELLGEACAVYAKHNNLIDPAIGDFIDGQTLHEFQFALDCETEASDAFLAEVRAQARNELIDELEARFTELSQTSPTPELRSGAAGAAGFVSTFRKGVQS
ncbi:hypothetical protein ACRRAT_14125 [Enterobacter hormaechei]|uniref:hypothetical protein n=1 Tax=Enterobacter hormaechei TaxID=158836 RepID=UPI001BDFD679|nr:hypothetical protein [Enterobacter hormaechei]MBT1858644.1 hypothetical protein [Enterobacter hormaechei subsp. xiangfangensis]MDT8098509.1 hypothetical protein [Enterobacter hormaechei]MDT8251969.1 hypothetical protein [Enterobacter hormaechei]MDY7177118.1 hypothetical protein [Enterobacter hormaechei]MDY7633227.1 hypothetical protein [Enterobacter hormaechei]